jgi:hypothetical protein
MKLAYFLRYQNRFPIYSLLQEIVMWIRKLKTVSAGVAILSLVACGTTGMSSDNEYKSVPRGETNVMPGNPASSDPTNNPSSMPGDNANMPTPGSDTMDDNSPATQPRKDGG